MWLDSIRCFRFSSEFSKIWCNLHAACYKSDKLKGIVASRSKIVRWIEKNLFSVAFGWAQFNSLNSNLDLQFWVGVVENEAIPTDVSCSKFLSISITICELLQLVNRSKLRRTVVNSRKFQLESIKRIRSQQILFNSSEDLWFPLVQLRPRMQMAAISNKLNLMFVKSNLIWPNAAAANAAIQKQQSKIKAHSNQFQLAAELNLAHTPTKVAPTIIQTWPKQAYRNNGTANPNMMQTWS